LFFANGQVHGLKAHELSIAVVRSAASMGFMQFCLLRFLCAAFSTLLAWGPMLPQPASAQPAPVAVGNAEDAYTRTISKRSADIINALALTDAMRSNRVQAILIAQYRSLNTWHEQNDKELKALNKAANGPDKEAAANAKEQSEELHAGLKRIHNAFLGQLEAELSPEQIETVKDMMTYGKVQFTYKGFLVAVPNMTEEEKGHVLALLKEARELAMDGGSAEEKAAIFGKYKGKINNYLSKRGHDISGKSKSKQTPSSPPPPSRND
jgi:Spy/CpxP family protein refolding chaperone